MNLVEITARWNTPTNEKLAQLGIEMNETYVFRNILINPEKITFIDEYEDYIYIGMDTVEEGFITDIPYKQLPSFLEKLNCQIIKF